MGLQGNQHPSFSSHFFPLGGLPRGLGKTKSSHGDVHMDFNLRFLSGRKDVTSLMEGSVRLSPGEGNVTSCLQMALCVSNITVPMSTE